MMTSARARYAGYRFPCEIISHAVWLYFRFPLGLRMVEELLAARGIIVSHETVRQWARKFGQQFANRIRRRLPRTGDKWHLDGVSRTLSRRRRCGAVREMRAGPSTPRRSGAGVKPLQAAVVKSDGGERCSKRRDESPSGVIRRGERKQTADEVSKCHRRCQNRGVVQLPGSARELS
jgi:putative transposase